MLRRNFLGSMIGLMVAPRFEIFADHCPINDHDLLINRLLRLKNLSTEQLLKFRVALVIDDVTTVLTPFQGLLWNSNSLILNNSNFEAKQTLSFNKFHLVDDEDFIIGTEDYRSYNLTNGDQFKVTWTLGNAFLMLTQNDRSFHLNNKEIDPKHTIAERLVISHAPEKRKVI